MAGDHGSLFHISHGTVQLNWATIPAASQRVIHSGIPIIQEFEQSMKEVSRPFRFLQLAEGYVYLAASYVLIFAAAVLIVEAMVGAVMRTLGHDYGGAVIYLLDRVLLAMMVAEIVYTLGNVIRSRHLDAEPFLIVGIIGAVRRMLVVTAESVEHANLIDPRFQAGTMEIGLLTLVILILAVSIRVMRGASSLPGNGGES